MTKLFSIHEIDPSKLLFHSREIKYYYRPLCIVILLSPTSRKLLRDVEIFTENNEQFYVFLQNLIQHSHFAKEIPLNYNLMVHR